MMENNKIDPTVMKNFTLSNGSVYKYRDLSPLEAIPYCAKVAKILAPFMMAGQSVGEALAKAVSCVDNSEITELFRFALNRCYNSKSEGLENDAIFNKWFSEHPDDLLEAGARAVYNLTLPFIPSSLGILNLEKS